MPSLTSTPSRPSSETRACSRAGRARCRVRQSPRRAIPSPVRVGRIDHHLGALLARQRGRRLGEGRVEEIVRGRGRELERPLLVRRFVDRPMIRQARHRVPVAAQAVVGEGACGQSALKRNLPSGKPKPDKEMRLLERRLKVEPARRLQRREVAVARFAQGPVDDLARAHRERRVLGAETLRQRDDHLVVRAAALRRLDDLRRELQVLVAARGVDVVVFEEHRRGQHDVGVARRVGHELLVHAGEQVLAREAVPHLLLMRARRRAGWCSGSASPHRRAALQRLRVAGQDRADPRLVESGGRRNRACRAPRSSSCAA